jgi:hypothetical protein
MLWASRTSTIFGTTNAAQPGEDARKALDDLFG